MLTRISLLDFADDCFDSFFRLLQRMRRMRGKPVRLSVDLRDATKHIFHAKLTFPVTAGPLTLVYPKWIPGEHSPVGPIVNLTGLILSCRRQRNRLAARRRGHVRLSLPGTRGRERTRGFAGLRFAIWTDPGTRKSVGNRATGNFKLVHRAPLSTRSEERRSDLHSQFADPRRMEIWNRAAGGKRDRRND